MPSTDSALDKLSNNFNRLQYLQQKAEAEMIAEMDRQIFRDIIQAIYFANCHTKSRNANRLFKQRNKKWM